MSIGIHTICISFCAKKQFLNWYITFGELTSLVTSSPAARDSFGMTTSIGVEGGDSLSESPLLPLCDLRKSCHSESANRRAEELS